MPSQLLRYERVTSADLLLDPPGDDVLILCAAAPENHGPHLPLGTDAILTEEVARRLGGQLLANRPERRVWLHPTWHLGGATIRGIGSVKIPSRLLRKALTAYLRRFVRQGFRHFVLLSTHGAPPHTGALDAACAELRKLGAAEQPVWAIAPTARLGSGAFFGDYANEVRQAGVPMSDDDAAALAWDLHGGRLETSMMLATDAALVDRCYAELPEIEPPRRRWLTWLRDALGRVGDRLLKNDLARRDFRRALLIGAHDLSWIIRGRKEGYVGRPALASAAEGEALLQAISRDLAAAVEDHFAGRLGADRLRSAATLLTLAMAVGGALVVGLVAGLVLLLG